MNDASTDWEALAQEDAKSAIEAARSSTTPVVFITGNSHMPPLRAFGNAETAWQSDDYEAWETYVYAFEAALSSANVLLDGPEYDNSLYVVDLNRWSLREDHEDAEELDGMFEHNPACTGCEHDCPHRRKSFGAPFCSFCDDHMEAGGEE